jgi:hypothetical protein
MTAARSSEILRDGHSFRRLQQPPLNVVTGDNRVSRTRVQFQTRFKRSEEKLRAIIEWRERAVMFGAKAIRFERRGRQNFCDALVEPREA